MAGVPEGIPSERPIEAKTRTKRIKGMEFARKNKLIGFDSSKGEAKSRFSGSSQPINPNASVGRDAVREK